MPPTRPALALFPAFAGAGAGAAQEAAPETTPEVGVAVEAPARTPEELAARYAAALRAHFLPGQAPDDPGATVEDDAILAAPPGLEGTWLRGLNLVAPDPTALDPDRLAQACGVQGAELAATTPRSFELRIPYPAEGGGSASFAERHDFLGGNTFLRSFDEAASWPASWAPWPTRWRPWATTAPRPRRCGGRVGGRRCRSTPRPSSWRCSSPGACPSSGCAAAEPAPGPS